jgi:glucosyl-dolichyl phosphate glucuronosyltransferase
MTDISVIISAYTEKRWNELLAAVESVQNQMLPPREIIVVIDHNPPLMQRARSQFSDVIVVENRETQGASGTKNSGIEAARGDIIVFLDDDAVATPDWLQMLSAGYEDPQVVGVGGKLEPWWPHGRPRWFPDEFDWVVGCTYRGLPETTSPIRNLIGANMSFRREVLEEIKYYSGIGHTGTRPFGGMDPDLCIRITQRWPDKVLLYEPKAHVYHHVDLKRTSWRYFWLRCYNEGLSKAVLTRRVGSQEGLSSERKYTLHTLPQGVLRGFADAVRGDISGLGRAVAIITGLTITTTGYLLGLAGQRLTKRKSIHQQRVPYKSA